MPDTPNAGVTIYNPDSDKPALTFSVRAIDGRPVGAVISQQTAWDLIRKLQIGLDAIEGHCEMPR